MSDLFGSPAPEPEKPKKAEPIAPKPSAPQPVTQAYGAAEIEILEGLEPVRRRPGMYIGGTDINAYHHLCAVGPKICGSGWNRVVVPRRFCTRPTFTTSSTTWPRENWMR